MSKPAPPLIVSLPPKPLKKSLKAPPLNVSVPVKIVDAMPWRSDAASPLWNVVAGSAQIVTNGVETVPTYKDATHPGGLLEPGGPNEYSNEKSWYAVATARTAIGLSRDRSTLTLFTVDVRGGSEGSWILVRLRIPTAARDSVGRCRALWESAPAEVNPEVARGQGLWCLP